MKKLAGFSGPKKHTVEPSNTQLYQDQADAELAQIGVLIDRFPEEISHWAANLDSSPPLRVRCGSFSVDFQNLTF